ncbi:hypothetical protein [Bradyrhizobium barranii]
MHSPHATWETSLVIPETAKPIDQQTLDALLRIEELLTQLLGRPETVKVSQDFSDLVEETIEESKKPKQRKTK